MRLDVRFLLSIIFVAGTCAVLPVFGVAEAAAATVYVNSSTGNDTTGDGSSGSPYKTFHKGYTAAAADDTIDLTGTFTWTDADETGDASQTGYTLGKNLTITGRGAGSTIIQAASSDNTADRRVFRINNGVTVTINSVTIRYGRTTSSSYSGGGIEVRGTLNLNDSDVFSNRAGESGGGIDVKGKATITDCSIRNNVAYYMGGGIARDYYGGDGSSAPAAGEILELINSTVTGNTVTASVAYLDGGGIHFRRGSGYITNSTITKNAVTNGQDTNGIGTDDTGSYVYLKNSIIAENNLSGCWDGDIGHRQTGYGHFVDNGGNIIGKLGYSATVDITMAATSWLDNPAGCATPDGTYVLQDGTGTTTGALSQNATVAINDSPNGTYTHAITSASSIVVDNATAGSNGATSVPAQDQRGGARVGSADIGAYEYGSSLPDITAPTVASVSSDKADGYYKEGEVIDIDVTFSEPVTSAGAVTVTLETGTVDRTCTFTITSSIAGTCNYTVQAGDTSSDLTVSSISGTITDGAGNAMTSFTPAVNLAANKALVIDTTAPTVSNITSSKANGTYSTGEVIAVTFWFSEYSISSGGVTAALETGSSDYSWNFNFSGTAATMNYTVRAGDESPDLTVATIGGTIRDRAGNEMTNFTPATNLAANKDIVIDAVGPTITSISSDKADGSYGVGEVIDIDVTFSEPVTSAGSVTLTLETGTTDRTCAFTVTSTIAGTCNYTVQTGDTSLDLDVASVAGSITDGAGNAMTNFTPTTGLAANKSLAISSSSGGGGRSIDSTPPAVTLVAPNGGEVWTAGTEQMIFWQIEGPVSTVKIKLSVDGGSTFSQTVHEGYAGAGYASWTVPDTATESAVMRIEAVGTSASDESDAPFTIVSAASENSGDEGGNEDEQGEDGQGQDEQGQQEHDGHVGDYDVVDVMTSSENISYDKELPEESVGGALCEPGQLIKLPNDFNPATQDDSAVYYCGTDGKRHVFPNAKTYMSWYDDYSGVVEVSAEVMAQIPIGELVTYRPGANLVKLATDPCVYAVSHKGTLRWVKTEDVAARLYGSNWSSLVDDVSDAFFTSYRMGSDIE